MRSSIIINLLSSGEMDLIKSESLRFWPIKFDLNIQFAAYASNKISGTRVINLREIGKYITRHYSIYDDAVSMKSPNHFIILRQCDR